MADAGPYPPSVGRLIEQFGTLPGIGKRTAERLAFHVLGSSRDDALAFAMAIRDVKTQIRACVRCFNVAEGELCTVCANGRRDHGLICVVELPRDIMAFERTGAYPGVYHVLQGRLSPSAGIGPDQLRIRELLRRVRGPASPPTERPADPADPRLSADSSESTEPPAAEAAHPGSPPPASPVAPPRAEPSGGEVAAMDTPAVRGESESSTKGAAGQRKADQGAKLVDTPVHEVILALNPTTDGDVTAEYIAEQLSGSGVRISRLARGLASGTELESTAPSSLQYALEGRQVFQ